MSAARHRWLRRAGLLVGIALATHLVAVWALPRLIMARVIAGARPERGSGVFLPPMTDHTQRQIVMPSPDMLYATCAFDLGDAPLRVRADPHPPGYWSIALYASSSDNFFVINDRAAAGRPIDLLLVGPDGYREAPAAPPGTTLVTAPSRRGLLLMRVLVGDYASERDRVESARASLHCEPAGGG